MNIHQGYKEATGEKNTDEEKLTWEPGWCFHIPFHIPTEILPFCSLHFRRLKISIPCTLLWVSLVLQKLLCDSCVERCY